MKLKAFSLFFLITLFAQAQFSLSGRVVSTETGAPVPKAEVWNKTTGKLTKAAENGNFEVMDLEEGTYEFAVFGYDYEIINHTITIYGNQEMEFRLLPITEN